MGCSKVLCFPMVLYIFVENVCFVHRSIRRPLGTRELGTTTSNDTTNQNNNNELIIKDDDAAANALLALSPGVPRAAHARARGPS